MDVFDKTNQDDQSNVNNNAAPNPVDIWVEKLGHITREDGTPKYETVEQALDALKASQEHISRLETENATFADKVKENETLQETIKRLSGNMNTNEKPTEQTPPVNGGQSVEAAEERIKQILDNELKQRDAVNTAVSNLKRVNDTLINRFGNKAGEVVVEKAKQLGTTPEKLKNLAASDPSLVLELFGNTPSHSSPNLSSVSIDRRPNTQEKIERPAKSLLSGPAATDRNRIDHLAKIRAKVYKENGIT